MLICSCDMQMFNHGDMQQAGILHAWHSKARVQHDDRDFGAAKGTAAAGLAALEEGDKMSSPAPEADLEELALIVYSSLWELGDTVRAAEGFRKIAGMFFARQTWHDGLALTCSLAASLVFLLHR